MSEAIKLSFSPNPTISGLSFLTAIILSGSLFAITPIAKLPSNLAVAFTTASKRFLPSL